MTTQSNMAIHQAQPETPQRKRSNTTPEKAEYTVPVCEGGKMSMSVGVHTSPRHF